MVKVEMIHEPKVLFSIPTKHHIEIAVDEMDGLAELGYSCSSFSYSANEGVESNLGRVWVVLKNAINLIKKAYRFDPDIIYLNSRVELLAGLRDALTILIFKSFYYRKVKFIIKSHGSDLEVLSRQNFFTGKVILPILQKSVSAWLFLSTDEKKQVDTLHFSRPDRVFVTKNIVRADQFRRDPLFKAQLSIPDDHTTLLFVGRLIREKGVYEVIESLACVYEKYKTILIIVGWGAELEALKIEVARLGISDKIIFTGFIPEAKVVDFYSNCDILVFPTYFPEGFPMALFNSVAAGMCVVTTPIRAANDYLSDPENCLWVNPRDSQSVFTAVDQLLTSVHLRSQMGANNLKKGLEFGKEQVCKELSAIIQKVFLHHV